MTNYLRVPKALSEALGIEYTEAVRLVDLVWYLIVSSARGTGDDKVNCRVTPYVGNFKISSSSNPKLDVSDYSASIVYKPSSALVKDILYAKYEDYDPSINYLESNLGASIIASYDNLIKDYLSVGSSICGGDSDE